LRDKDKINEKSINEVVVIFQLQRTFYLIKINYESLTKNNKKRKKKNKQKTNAKSINASFVNQRIRKNVASKIKDQQTLKNKRSKDFLKTSSRTLRIRRQESLRKILKNINKNLLSSKNK